MSPTEATQPTMAAQAEVEEQFSLAPAIFTVFPGFPRDPPLVDATEKLERIIKNLDKQHDAVKRNMLFLIERRADDLVKKAKRDLAELEDADHPCQTRAPRNNEDIRNTIRRIRTTAKTGAPPGAYEIKDDTFKDPDPSLLSSTGQDVEMGTSAPRSREAIRADLTHELRDLAMRGASEMEQYEAHAEETTKMYKQSLERRKKSKPSASSPEVPPAPPKTGPPKGILVHKSERPPDREIVKKKATFGDVVRRESR